MQSTRESKDNAKIDTEEASDNEKNKHQKLQLGFWNIAGVAKKNSQFWDYTKEYDFIGLVETWVEKRDWDELGKELPKEFKWKAVPARREHKKGRAKGGVITGVKKYLLEDDSNVEMEQAQERTIYVQGKKIRILTVYSREGRENVWEAFKENYEEPEEAAVIIGGDFNARTGGKGAGCAGGGERKSKDKKIDKVGKEFLKVLREKNWSILNGTTDGDKEGNFTFVGACGSSVIDYAVVNSLALATVKDFAVEKRTESDHMPIKITLKLNVEEAEREDKNGNETEAKVDADEEYENLIKAIAML